MFLFSACSSLAVLISDLLHWPQNWLFLHSSHFGQMTFLPPSLRKSKSSFSKLRDKTSQTKSINLSAALSSPHCPPVVTQEVSLKAGCSCLLWIPPLQGACYSLFSPSFSFTFSPSPTLPFPLLLFLACKPAEVCSNLKLHSLQAFTSLLPFLGSILKALLPSVSFSTLALPLLPHLFQLHFNLSFQKAAPPYMTMTAALDSAGHDSLLETRYTYSSGSPSSSLGNFLWLPLLDLHPLSDL